MSADAPPETTSPELSRIIKARLLPAEPVAVKASDAECANLAKRFGIVSVESLVAQISLEKTASGVSATGPLKASITQACAVSGETFPVIIGEQLDLAFIDNAVLAARDDGAVNDDGVIEVDLFADNAEEIGYCGDTIDLGEAIAQSLGLAIDPYAEGPGADAARAEAGIADETAPTGPLASALSEALKKG